MHIRNEETESVYRALDAAHQHIAWLETKLDFAQENEQRLIDANVELTRRLHERMDEEYQNYED